MPQSLAPLLGCGVMMLACVALMAGSGRRRNTEFPRPKSRDDIAALRAEVARLRRLDEQRRATPAEDPAP